MTARDATPDAEVPARDMSDAEIAGELLALDDCWDALFTSDFEGHSGSPGERMAERMDELETEQRRRTAGLAAARNEGGEG